MVGLIQRCFRKESDTSDMADLTVPWRSIFFLVVTNWFLCNEVANDDTRTILCSCGTPPKTLSAMPEFVRNMHHLSHFPDCLVAVDLAMLLVTLRMLLAMIFSRESF